MQKGFLRICSLILTLVMLLNTLPTQSIALLWPEKSSTTPAASALQAPEADPFQSTQAYIVQELEEERTQYSKEFLLSNGLHMATVYPHAVHYETSSGWKEIDNTLVAHTDGSYRNTAGIWNVSFPGSLGGSDAVEITKDGYTLSFQMAGQLLSAPTSMQLTTQEQTLEKANLSTAQVQSVDILALQEAAVYPQTVPTKLQSRVMYEDVYTNTHVLYDLESNKVKESIVLEQYNAALQGYSYALQVGELVPQLQEDGSILLLDKEEENIVLAMPAPYLTDSAMAYCDDITVELVGKGGTYILTYLLPQQWLSSQERAWPVVLDPVVSPTLSTANIQDKTVGQKRTYTNEGILDAGYYSSDGITRFYLKYTNLPGITSSDVIVDASIRLYKPQNSSTTASIEVHKVTGTWSSSDITWEKQDNDGVGDSVFINPNIEDFAIVKNAGDYYWSITDIVRGWYASGNTGMMFKASDEVETAQINNYKQFYSSDYADFTSSLPILSIVFRNNNGLESYWDYTSHSAGRAGVGSVNNFTGNLVWTHTDMGFGGNRMPVTISHVYNLNDSAIPSDRNNSNDTGGNSFGMGNGWRSNFNQLVYRWEITDGTVPDAEYYIWEDTDGTDHYFKYASANTYKDEDGLELTLTTNGTGNRKYCITDKLGGKSYFDTQGRLTEIQNNQATPSSITVSYTSTTSKLISTVTDGVGRVYSFSYTNGLLSRISYKGTGTEELYHVAYSYIGSNLTRITYKDDETCSFAYEGSRLASATDIDGYTLSYNYNTVSEAYQPYRVQSVSAAENNQSGGSLTFTYAHNQTTLEDHNGNVSILQFNDFGNLTCVQDDEGRAQFTQYAKNTTQDTGKANQVSAASKLQYTVGNLAVDSSFENSLVWNPDVSMAGSDGNSISIAYSYHGSKSMRVCHLASAASINVQPGETLVFSAYVKTTADNHAILALSSASGLKTYQISSNTDWARYEISYTNTDDYSDSITPIITTEGSDCVYVDCVQLEIAPTASRYNMAENGSFSTSGTPALGWTGTNLASTDGRTTVTDTAAPQLDSNVFAITGNPTAQKTLTQQLPGGDAGDAFVFGGWAKGNAAPVTDFDTRGRAFRIRLTFQYTDNTTETFDANFNPDTDQWQFAAQKALAARAYSAATLQIQYHYNVNTVYFDGIQLFEEQFGNTYTYDDKGNVVSVQDLQKQITQYEYNANNDLIKIIQDNKAKVTYTYDNHHNVLTAVTEEGLNYSFSYDTYGNNTSVSAGAGDSKITGSAVYSSDGNRLVSSTDALGNTTTYNYHPDTNVLISVQYPEDSTATQTGYTYDQLYRILTASATTDTGANLSVSYTYEDDLLTEIETPKTTYSFAYGDFSLRTMVSVGNRTLAEYSYTNDANHWLDSLDYGNDGMVEYEYDNKGRIIKETYEDGDSVTYAYDNSGALATVTDSATGIKTTYYYDSTDRLMKYTESGGGYSHSVGYTFDQLNNLTQMVQTINGSTRTTDYTYDDDNRVTSVTVDGTTVEYTYDTYGRLSQKLTKRNGATVKTETYTYKETETGTSSQIDTYTVETALEEIHYTYTYDGNGNILSIQSNGTSYAYSTIEQYTYDSANQLIQSSSTQLGRTFAWTYDDNGNILTRSMYDGSEGTTGTLLDSADYAYGDDDWGDLLTAYDGQGFSYDEIGNLTNDGTWCYSWEHGRQLASMVKADNSQTWSYTYNADGMRTKRTDGTTTYTYIYNGSQLSRMTMGSHTLYFTYDASGTPLTLTLDSTRYDYLTNLQGDVVGIADSTGTIVVKYIYDAWGNQLSCTGSAATTLGVYNPLRYRGYVYDQETGLYYLQSRYYDPEIGRFINSDTLFSTGQGFLGNNMMVYCLNNPVCMMDYTGEDAIYVVDYDTDTYGLPVVGHAYVYIQDAVGNWYKTEFTGPKDDPSQAIISCEKVTNTEEITQMLNGEKIKKKNYVYLQGDFSESVDYAKECDGTDYGGYCFFRNNCAHYAQDVLKKGDYRYSNDRRRVRSYMGIIPGEFYNYIKPSALELAVRNTMEPFPITTKQMILFYFQPEKRNYV